MWDAVGKRRKGVGGQMPLESIICRRALDESRGNPWICECFQCSKEREEIQKEQEDEMNHLVLDEA